MSIKEAIPGSVRSKLSPQLQELIELLDIKFIEPKFVYRYLGFDLPFYVGGIWDAEKDIICVRESCGTGVDEQDFYFMHEIIHWAGAPGRLNRCSVLTSENSEDLVARDTEEATAELGMYKLSVRLGLDSKRAKAYNDRYLLTLAYADFDKAEKDSDIAVDYLLKKAYGSEYLKKTA